MHLARYYAHEADKPLHQDDDNSLSQATRLEIAADVSDPPVFCVTPIPHRMQVPSASRIISAVLISISFDTPVTFSA